MLRKTMILLPATLLGALPFAASAETMDPSELDMFRAASVTLQQAGDEKWPRGLRGSDDRRRRPALDRSDRRQNRRGFRLGAVIIYG